MEKVAPQPHHLRGIEIDGRPMYRRGRRPTAVKVYTVADESQHILMFGVPALNLKDDVVKLSEKYGEVTVIQVHDYPNLEEFTDLYHIRFNKLAPARAAKRRLDGHEFFGGILHVCYAPELESVEETRSKIIQRSKQVYALIRNKGVKKFRSFDGAINESVT